VDAVRFEAVEKRFGTTTALAGSSFAITRGEMFGLIGPDGAGKTTAIRLLCGLLRPDAGKLDLEARGEVKRVPHSRPQLVKLG
jgi:ABC-type multidrug transport system ATPase subunit